MVSNHCQLLEIDLNTMKKEDLNFDVPFTLTVRQNDYLHAFVTYFNVEFSKCHKRTWFSTAPEAPYTHWKQTVFYLHDYATVKKVNEAYSTVCYISQSCSDCNCRRSKN